MRRVQSCEPSQLTGHLAGNGLRRHGRAALHDSPGDRWGVAGPGSCVVGLGGSGERAADPHSGRVQDRLRAEYQLSVINQKKRQTM